MAKQNNTIQNYVLPTDNEELLSFTLKNKINMMEQVVTAIFFAVSNNLSIVEVFQFKDSDFVITISDKDYLTNLDNIFSYYMKSEKYEYCPRVVELQKTLKQQHEKQTRKE